MKLTFDNRTRCFNHCCYVNKLWFDKIREKYFHVLVQFDTLLCANFHKYMKKVHENFSSFFYLTNDCMIMFIC